MDTYYYVQRELLPFTGYIADAVISSNGKYLVTAEFNLVQIWNLPSRVVLHKDYQEDVVQLEKLESGGGANSQSCFVAFSCNEFSENVEKEGMKYRY